MATTFKFGDVLSTTLGLSVEKRAQPATVERRKTIHRIAGRDDDLYVDEGCYNNITLAYAVGCSNIDAHITQIRNVFAFKTGYQKLEDNRDNGVFRRAFVTNPVQFTEDLKNFGHATIEFSADPYLYYKTGETAITIARAGTTLSNPESLYVAKPLIVAQGTAGQSMTFYIQGKSYLVTFPPGGKITIDSLNETAYTDTTNACKYLEFEEFPYLPDRNNITVSFTGGSSLNITPRWRRL